MSWMIPVGVCSLMLWSFSARVNRLERLRFAVLMNQALFLLLSVLRLMDLVSDVSFFIGCVVVFFGFCLFYQKSCARHENNLIRFLMLTLIVSLGLSFGMFVRPSILLPLILSCMLYHLQQYQISRHIEQQDSDVRAMKDYIQELKGRVHREKKLCGKDAIS